MKNSATTDWDVLLSSKCSVTTLNKFASGAESTRGSRVVLPTLRKQASLESWLELTEAHTHVGLLEKPYVTEVL